MFSTSDIRELLQAFPPARPESPWLRESGPFLVPNASGDGYVVSTYLSEEFENLLASSSGRPSIASIASQLNVSEDTILQLSQKPSGSTLLSRNKQHVCSNEARQEILDKLLDRASQGLVLESSFSQEVDITFGSVSKLIDSYNSGLSPEEAGKYLLIHAESDQTINRRFIYSRSYRESIEKALREGFDEASAEAKEFAKHAEDISSSSLSFTLEVARHVVSTGRTTGTIPDGHFDISDNRIHFRPKSFDMKQKQEILRGLKNAETSYVQIAEIVPLYPESHGDTARAKELLLDEMKENIILLGNLAVSSAWLNSWIPSLVEAVKSKGYVNLSDGSSQKDAELQKAALDHARESHVANDTDPIELFNGFLVRTSWLDLQQKFIGQKAREQAEAHWEGLLKSPENECILKMSELFPTPASYTQPELPPLDEELVKTILSDPETVKRAEAAYSEEVKQRLQPETEAQFRSFWIDKVLARFQLYRAGVEGIEEEKLRDQLTEVLQFYILKDLVPDAISKARSRGYLRVKKIQRDLEKLTAALKEGPTSLNSIQSSLDKTNRQQGMRWVEASELASKKDAYLQELRRSAQKDSDGPRLFLTTVLVLLAKQKDGVVYATGKYAPRLLKQLKPKLDEEEYKRLDGWKENVKAGSLTKEDKEAMKALV